MVSKQKLYREKRIEIIRNCIIMLTDIIILSKKKSLDLISLNFLKKIEKEIKGYHKLVCSGSTIPRNRGKDSF